MSSLFYFSEFSVLFQWVFSFISVSFQFYFREFSVLFQGVLRFISLSSQFYFREFSVYFSEFSVLFQRVFSLFLWVFSFISGSSQFYFSEFSVSSYQFFCGQFALDSTYNLLCMWLGLRYIHSKVYIIMNNFFNSISRNIIVHTFHIHLRFMHKVACRYS